MAHMGRLPVEFLKISGARTESRDLRGLEEARYAEEDALEPRTHSGASGVEFRVWATVRNLQHGCGFGITISSWESAYPCISPTSLPVG